MMTTYDFRTIRTARTTKIFPPGAKVYINGRVLAKVREAFPEGSTSYSHPHYKVDIQGGERNVAVPFDQVGVTLKRDRPSVPDFIAAVKAKNWPEVTFCLNDFGKKMGFAETEFLDFVREYTPMTDQQWEEIKRHAGGWPGR